MKHYLEAISEPTSLVLAWQSSDLRGTHRYRYAVGQVEPGSPDTFRYFAPGAEFEARNQGRSYSELEGLGYRGYPAFDRNVAVHTSGVMDALMRRLPPRSRSDFPTYAGRFLLPPDRKLSDLALLGRTEATLPSDGFSLVDPLDPDVERCDLLLEVAGYRYYADEVDLLLGQQVEIVADDDNEHDPAAVDFRLNGLKFGNVNRLQARTFRKWLERSVVEGWVERLNGTPDRPRVFVFVRVVPDRSRIAA